MNQPRFARFLTDQSRILTDFGLLVLRLAVAAVFIPHGWGDVFDAGVSTNIQNYRDAGIPLPALSAPFAAYVQLVGGILFLCGALTRPLSAGFMVVMAGALLYVHRGEPLGDAAGWKRLRVRVHDVCGLDRAACRGSGPVQHR